MYNAQEDNKMLNKKNNLHLYDISSLRTEKT